MIIGTPKTLDDVTTLPVPAILELEKSAMQIVESGTPPTVPTAIPLGLLVQIMGTLSKYRKVADTVANIEAGVNTEAELRERWDKAIVMAQDLINQKMPEQPKVVPVSGSKLILP